MDFSKGRDDSGHRTDNEWARGDLIKLAFRAILDNAYSGILIIDDKARVFYANKWLEEFHNLSLEQIKGRDVEEFFPYSKLKRALKERVIVHEELDLRYRDQTVVSRYPIMDGEKVLGAMSVFRRIDQIEGPALKLRRQMAKSRLKTKYTLDQVITRNEAIIKLKKIAEIFAESSSTILITGESGTGKELFAQSIHSLSDRKDMPFVALNCAALAESLLEAELFGYAEGAFTGARKGGQPGLFQLAHNGTLFLDEIGEMPLAFQSKLLRVLQERQVRPVGGGDIVPVNVRVIAATNRDLRRETEDGRFRLDLFYRLSVLTLDIPPLRERKEDLPALAEAFFIRGGHRELWAQHQPEIARLLVRLSDYDFPGNIRELENFLEMAILLLKKGAWDEDAQIGTLLFRPRWKTELRPAAASGGPGDPDDDRDRLLRVLQKHRGDKKKAALEMGYSLPTLYRHLKKLKIPLSARNLAPL